MSKNNISDNINNSKNNTYKNEKIFNNKNSSKNDKILHKIFSKNEKIFNNKNFSKIDKNFPAKLLEDNSQFNANINKFILNSNNAINKSNNNLNLKVNKSHDIDDYKDISHKHIDDDHNTMEMKNFSKNVKNFINEKIFQNDENNYVINSSKNDESILLNNNDNSHDLNSNASTNSTQCNHFNNKIFTNDSPSLEGIKTVKNTTENFKNSSLNNSKNNSSPTINLAWNMNLIHLNTTTQLLVL